MKRSKTLITYYIITILLALISLISYKQRGNDFFVALSSLTADITLIISVVFITYTLFYCCSYMKEKIEKSDKKIINKLFISLLILLITMITIFMCFISIYSHKNIFEFIKELIDKKENMDVLILFFNSVLVYFLLFLFACLGIIVNNRMDKNEECNSYIGFVIVFLIIILLLRLIFNIRLYILVITMNIVLLGLTILLLKKKSKKKEK